MKGNIFDKLKKIKNIEIIGALIIICVVVLLFYDTFFKTEKTTNNELFGVTMEDANSNSSDKSTIEINLENILSQIEGVGNVKVMITYLPQSIQTSTFESITSEAIDVSGCIIVAEGANDINVKLELIKAAKVVLNLPTNSIEVFKMEK